VTFTAKGGELHGVDAPDFACSSKLVCGQYRLGLEIDWGFSFVGVQMNRLSE
jgi:hypothetical protein